MGEGEAGPSWLEFQALKEMLAGLVFPGVSSHCGGGVRAGGGGGVAGADCRKSPRRSLEWFSQTLEHPKKAIICRNVPERAAGT